MVIYNNEIKSNISINPLTDRAFQYGDGLFESIKVIEKKIYHLDYHLERLQESMLILGFENPILEKNTIEIQIEQLLLLNKINDARVKIVVWRKDGGLYTPKNQNWNYLISTQELTQKNPIIEKIGLSKTRVPIGAFSNLKTINSLYYVLASKEKNDRYLDEIILLNTENKICEASSSNVFWVENGKHFTPSLDCGCIAGIGRKIFIEELLNDGIEVIEGSFEFSKLAHCEKIIFTNAIRRIAVQNVNWVL